MKNWLLVYLFLWAKKNLIFLPYVERKHDGKKIQYYVCTTREKFVAHFFAFILNKDLPTTFISSMYVNRCGWARGAEKGGRGEVEAGGAGSVGSVCGEVLEK